MKFGLTLLLLGLMVCSSEATGMDPTIREDPILRSLHMAYEGTIYHSKRAKSAAYLFLLQMLAKARAFLKKYKIIKQNAKVDTKELHIKSQEELALKKRKVLSLMRIVRTLLQDRSINTRKNALLRRAVYALMTLRWDPSVNTGRKAFIASMMKNFTIIKDDKRNRVLEGITRCLVMEYILEKDKLERKRRFEERQKHHRNWVKRPHSKLEVLMCKLSLRVLNPVQDAFVLGLSLIASYFCMYKYIGLK